MGQGSCLCNVGLREMWLWEERDFLTCVSCLVLIVLCNLRSPSVLSVSHYTHTHLHLFLYLSFSTVLLIITSVLIKDTVTFSKAVSALKICIIILFSVIIE